MNTNQARQPVRATMQPNAWKILLQKDGDESVTGNFQQLNLHLEADKNNASTVAVKVQDSPDGVTWTTRYTHANPIQPGGLADINTYFSRQNVRVVVMSTAIATVSGTFLRPEEQCTPIITPPALTCSTTYEVTSETGE